MLSTYSSHYSEKTLGLFCGSGKLKPFLVNHRITPQRAGRRGTCLISVCGLGEQGLFWRRKGPLSHKRNLGKQPVAESLQSWYRSRFEAWLEVHASGIAACSVCCFLQDRDGGLAWPREALARDLARPKGYGPSHAPGHPCWTRTQPKHTWQPEAGQVSSTHGTLCLHGGKKFKQGSMQRHSQWELCFRGVLWVNSQG